MTIADSAANDEQAGAPADIVVMSDLHLGRGRNLESGRFHTLEAFFYDDDFRRFCRYLCEDARRRGVPVTLVLNGDAFDLLRIEPEASPTASPLERRFGPASTPPVASAATPTPA